MKKNEESVEEVTFEQAMSQMEKIVQRLEEGDVPLEEAIGLFQDGMQLSKTCHQKLKTVEEKMDQVLDEEGHAKEFLVQEEDES